MSQSPKEQTAIATWNQLSQDLTRIGVSQTDGKTISDITEEIARLRGYTPEAVMEGLLQGVDRGELTISGDIVKFRA